jgi:hypothetical protein
MLIKIAHPHPIKPSEITAEAIYADRRHFLRQIGLATASAVLSGCGPPASDSSADSSLATPQSRRSIVVSCRAALRRRFDGPHG